MAWLSRHGEAAPIAIFLIVYAESGLMLFIPGETMVLLGGVAAAEGAIPLGPVAVAAMAGALLGDLTGFWLGRGPGRRRYERRGRFLFLRPPHVERIQRLLARFGRVAFILARFFPVARVAGPFVFGLSGVRPSRYLPLLALAALAWGGGFSLLGYVVGDAWTELHRWMGRAGLLALGIALLLALATWAARALRQRRRH
ncbi:MAG: DedA family protein [Deltaproteobacteria bacterium]